ncbi:unnamed protein product [Auanema sp. JU1783]|nr:unnamed protein product [Auanema sp. JU1783]
MDEKRERMLKSTITQSNINTFAVSPCFSKEKASLVRPFVELILQKRVSGIITDFRSHKRGNDYSKMTEFVAQNSLGRNRYKDVGCLDNNRVILQMGPVAYIHANYVSTPNNSKKFICTQGPMDSTCADFWYMILQENVNAILMLCNYIETGATKCAQYIPIEVGQSLKFGNDQEITVTAKLIETYKFPFKTNVRIQITVCEIQLGSRTHTCAQYHWLNWPDRGVPEADMVPIHLLKQLENEANGTPIVVHCSAGIGRSGTIILLQVALEIIRIGQRLNPLDHYMTIIRQQRNNSVQTEHQYLYVHQVLLFYFKQKGYLDPAILSRLEQFKKDYLKVTTGF